MNLFNAYFWKNLIVNSQPACLPDNLKRVFSSLSVSITPKHFWFEQMVFEQNRWFKTQFWLKIDIDNNFHSNIICKKKMNIFEGTNFSFERAFKEMLSEQVTYPEFEVQNYNIYCCPFGNGNWKYRHITLVLDY
jgi:hypothetical protein